VKKVIWFGSWVRGIPTPASDVDICLILESMDQAPRDRIARYLPDGFPVGIDVFAYTEDELTKMKAERPQWYQAIASGTTFTPQDLNRR